MYEPKQSKSGAIKTVLLIIGVLTVICGVIAAVKALEPKIKAALSACRAEDDEGEDAAEKVGDAIEDAAKEIGDAAKDAAEKVGDAAEDLVKND
ncbi:MAG: hypothetical protein II192_01680 [Clostridia bacterium]|nr:hypothetical protein [Clostridia bacterium]